MTCAVCGHVHRMRDTQNGIGVEYDTACFECGCTASRDEYDTGKMVKPLKLDLTRLHH